jgi:hypothetical protein
MAQKVKDWWETPPPDISIGKSENDDAWYPVGIALQVLGTFLTR